MPATTRKQPTSTSALPPKKRQRPSPQTLSVAPKNGSTPAAQPPPVPTPTPTPTAAPPLSAVAARRAAAAAANSAPPSPAAAPSPVTDAVEVHSHRVASAPAAEDDSDSSDSASDVEAALLVREPAKRKGKAKEAAKVSRKKEPVSRYFSESQQDEIRLETNEEDNRMQMEEVRDLGTPRAARPRRRREKTAFVDPECYSNFRLEENVNAWSTTVARENGSDCEAVVYGLRIGEDLVIHGTFDLTLLSGSISLFGSTLSTPTADSTVTLPIVTSSASHRVYSPASHPIPPISALPDDPAVAKPSVLSLYLNAQIDISTFAAVVVITTAQTGIEGIESSLKSGGLGCANALFPWPSAATGSVTSGRSWKLIGDPVPGLTILRQLEPWTLTLSSLVGNGADLISDGVITDPGRLTIMVEGSKRVGKSTFSKMLLNRLLDRYEAVAYLDTDLGQPEFSTPGFVSLNVLRKPVFGPAFTHLTLPISSHFLGSTSPASDPTSYMAAISSLLATYALEVEYPLVDEPVPSHSRRRNQRAARNESASTSSSRGGGKVRERVPLVINTQGWVKGLGADLLAKLKAESQPTHVCSFVSSVEDETGGYSDGGSTMPYAQHQYGTEEESLPYHPYTLPAAPPNPLESKWTASDYRTLSLVSYFYSNLGSVASPTTMPTSSFPSMWNFALPLVAQTPYALDWTRAADQISSVHLLDGDDIAYEHVLHALNGSLVAIVESDSPSHATTSSFPYDPSLSQISPSTSRSLGLGLVRSISTSTTSLHVVTPVRPPSTAVSLVKGALELPLALMLDHAASEQDREHGLKGVEWKEVPFLSIEEGEGAGRRRVRRNLMRRGHA